jgi:hypothetical protein
VDFSQLHDAIRRMGAKERKFNLESELSPIDTIDSDLERGITIRPDELEYIDNGLISYKGRQVLLYIQDHGHRVQDALDDGSTGNKYHLAYCRTLDNMHKRKRYDRYVVKNDISGIFFINGHGSYSKELIEGDAHLKVCKNCLNHLNYKNYSSNRNEVFNEFSLKDFFETYKSFFKHTPKRKAGKDKDGTYSTNWNDVSNNYRLSVGWSCESCRVQLEDNKRLLHTHHISGVKSNNSSKNLEALCIECHSKKDFHSHMKINKNDLKKLITIRRDQGL